MTPPFAAVALIAALALAGCGRAADVADMPPAHDSTATVSTATATAPAAAALPDQLAGRTFLSTAATGRELVSGSRIVLSFDDAASIGVNAGCNHMGGTAAWDGDMLIVPEMYMTEMACEQPLMDQDQWLADLLAGGVTVALSGSELTVAGGGVTLDLLDRRIAEEPAERTVPATETGATSAGWQPTATSQ